MLERVLYLGKETRLVKEFSGSQAGERALQRLLRHSGDRLEQ